MQISSESDNVIATTVTLYTDRHTGIQTPKIFRVQCRSSLTFRLQMDLQTKGLKFENVLFYADIRDYFQYKN